MKRLLTLGAGLAVLALAVAAIAIAAGGGGDSEGAPEVIGDTGDATVSAADVGDQGTVLVDSAGQALYAADEEAGGRVLCTDEACLSFWQPLTVSGGAPTGDSLPGELGVARRPDGDRQVTYDGRLLYTFSEDEPGEVTGDGFQDAFGGQLFTWHIVHADSADDSSDGGDATGGIYG